MNEIPRQSVQVSIQHLDPDHHHILVKAIHNVLSTELTELTLAELADGLPLWSTTCDMRGGSSLLASHPLFKHKTLCDRALENARGFRSAFDPAILTFDSHTIQAYQDSLPETRHFNMRLIELVALSIHQIGVMLFKYEPKLHDGDIDSVVSHKEERKWVNIEGRKFFQEVLYDPWPTLFFHVDFLEHEYYPNGLADSVGYWAEDRILGGVVLFDRGESGLESKDIYFQSGRQQATFRTWRLLPNQFDALVEFLLADQHPPRSPFPILATDENLHRYDPWYAIANHVYRDTWERHLPPKEIPDPRHVRDVISTGDYPEHIEVFNKIYARAEGLSCYDSRGNLVPTPPSPSPTPGLPLSEAQLRLLEEMAHPTLDDEANAACSGDEDRSDVNSLDELMARHIKQMGESENYGDDPEKCQGQAEGHTTQDMLEQQPGDHSQENLSK